MTKDNLEVTKTIVTTTNRLLSDQYTMEIAQDIKVLEDEMNIEEQLEMSEVMGHAYMELSVYYKDLIFDILEGKLTLDEVRVMMHGLERGCDQ